MGMFRNKAPPALPNPTDTYDAGYMNRLLSVFRLYFNEINAVQSLSLAGINLDIKTLPTEADIATIRVGEVYRDSTAGNTLKVKV